MWNLTSNENWFLKVFDDKLQDFEALAFVLKLVYIKA